ncbi:Reverse transcriptase (RNA-dependent DNA polymerase) [Fragilaria crotonensis]|nr:Reverse transcriptase (RNA-dependent DNA polymerase) [Fragilaria crotonensis]
MGQDGRLPKSWIPLDNQSTVDVFYNADLPTDIRKGTSNMDIHCNAGVTSTDMIGELQGYGTVWYHPDGITNILSLSRVKEYGYRMTYDSQGGNHFTVEKSDGSTCVVNESKRGLYFLDTNGAIEHKTLMINTVSNNRSNYTNRAYLKAVQARKIQQIIG